MPRRDSPRRKQEKAEDIARRLLSLQRTRGVPFVDGGGLWLLGRLPARPCNAAFLSSCLQGDLPPRMDLANALGCEEVIPLDAARLAKWRWSLAHLEGRRDLEELVREGVRPLRGYRGVDFGQRLQHYHQTLESFAVLVENASLIAACQVAGPEDSLPVSDLVALLPARLSLVGAWAFDPLEVLQCRDLPAEEALLDVSRAGKDPATVALAAVLLGRRVSRSAPGERRRLAAQMPASLVPLALESAATAHNPLLQAQAFTAGRGPLPSLAGIPAGELDSMLLAAERVAQLYGLDAGLRLLHNLIGPWQGAIEHTGTFRARLERLEELLDDQQRGRPLRPRSPDEAELVKEVRELSHAGQGAPRLLARLFVRWITGSEHGERYLGQRPLARVAGAAWAAGPLAALRALAEAWQTEAAGRFRAGEGTSHTALRARLRCTLSFIDTELAIPRHLSARVLDERSEWLIGLPAERIREVWPVVVTIEPNKARGSWPELIRASISAEVLGRIVRLDVSWPANSLRDRPAALVRYLDCVEALLDRNVPGIDVREGWLAGLFRTGPSCVAGVVLTLLRRARPGELKDRPAALRALSQDLLATGPLAEHARTLERALEAWSTPGLTMPAEQLPELAAALDVEQAKLVEYLHHRRLAGHGETFARALLEPLERVKKDAGEVEHIGKQIAELAEDNPKRGYLCERLCRLTDPLPVEGRRADSAARARGRLERSLELLRQESLERCLDEVYRTYLMRLLGKSIRSGALPAGMREALALLHAEHIKPQLLLDFLDDLLEGRSLRERAVNRAWLERARSAGIDTQCWLAGVRATSDVAGERITFTTETDPLHVLRMGSYFETCLTLETGSNAASTLVNALDVNKQVIYGRRSDGTVVCRKLIGATARGELAGYRTYASGNGDACSNALGQILAAFARRCRLRLSDTATPEVLHAGFWYDDGNEMWLAPAEATLAPPPAGEPQDPVGTLEYHLAAALREGDRNRLAAVFGQGSEDAGDAALFRLLLEPAVSEPSWIVSQAYDLYKVIARLAQRGSFHWLDRATARFGTWEVGACVQPMLRDLPWHAPTVCRAIRRVRQVADRKDAGTFKNCALCPSMACALAGVDELVELYEATIRLVHKEWLAYEISSEDLVARWADRFQPAWLRDRDSRPLVRALESKTLGLSAIITELACREVIPGLAPALRSCLARRRERSDVLALALGTQGQPGDGPRLLALLQQQPRSLLLALAVVRCGHEESAEAARRTWLPPRTLPTDVLTIARLRELASPMLARQLRRTVKDLARILATPDHPDGAAKKLELHNLLGTIALLGLPGPDAEPAALLAPYLQEPAFVDCYGKGNIQELAARQALWQAVCGIDENIGRLSAGDSSPLCAWREVAERVGFSQLIDERFERAVRQVVSGRDNPGWHEALGLWLDLAAARKPDHLGLILAVLGADLDGVGQDLRDRAAAGRWNSHPTYESAWLLEVLVWLRNRSWGQPEGVLETSASLQQSPPGEDAGLAALLALESGDAEQVQAARTILAACAQHHPAALLETIEQGFRWLRPETIEPVAAELLQMLPDSALLSGDLARRLRIPESSYRWQRLVLEERRRREIDNSALAAQLGEAKYNPRAPWLVEILKAEE
jgi:hypothetical protein